jgi:hypothetical protein
MNANPNRPKTLNEDISGILDLLEGKKHSERVAILMSVLKSQALHRWAGMTLEQAMRISEFEFESDVIDTPNGKLIVLEKLEYWIGDRRTPKRHRVLDIQQRWAGLDNAIIIMISEYLKRLNAI